MKATVASLLSVVAITLTAGAATAHEGQESEESGSRWEYNFGLALTLGEGMYFYRGDVYRGPVSFEVVPSFGWAWFKFDLGLCTAFESREIGGTEAGYWGFTFRPGGRLTPPMVPIYFRVAFPLEVQRHGFGWGLMFGLGADIPIVGILGIVFELDTTLSSQLSMGADGAPLEFRGGISLHF